MAFGLPIIRTVEPSAGFEGNAYIGDGPAINSANAEISLNGLGVVEAKRVIIDWLVANGAGESVVQYKLRDWLFSRQRYWGEPFPIVWDADGPIAVPEDQLPVELPEIDDYSPKTYDPDDADTEPEPPLSRATEWLDVGDGLARRDQHDAAVGGLVLVRAALPGSGEPRALRRPRASSATGWARRRPGDTGGVDLYVGGVEHAVLHLLYARFWHKVLYDLGHVSSEEPFRRLFNQGYIQAFAYTDARGTYVPAEEVVERSCPTDGWFHVEQPARPPGVREDGQVAEERGDARRDVRALRRRHVPAVRDVHRADGGVAAVVDARRRRFAAVPAAGVAQPGRRGDR